MQKSKKEFLEVVSTLYMITLLAVMPLYTQGSYWKLGDVKYMLFRNVSFLCLGVTFAVVVGVKAVELVQRLRRAAVIEADVKMQRAENAAEGRWGRRGWRRMPWSSMDIYMLVYGVCVIISALGSSYPQTAWLGYQDWYMGALSQLIFVGAYFLISRYYEARAWLIYTVEAAFAGVIVIGLLNRLGFDPLKLYEGLLETDWEYSHMLSTIGNINWFCGYCSVMLAFPMVGYLYGKTMGKRILLYFCSVCGLTLLCMQGSIMGPVIAVAGVGICLLAGLKNPRCFQRGLRLALGVCVLFPAMGGLIALRSAQAATPVDGDIYGVMLWEGWWLVAAMIGIICLLHYKLPEAAQGHAARTIVILGVISGICVLSYAVWKLSGTDITAWGSGRGGLWKAAFTGFLAGDWKQKLLGAGSDCFAEYIYRMPEAVSRIRMEGHWAEAVFANAHNEWLSQLINIGILGLMAYLSIFLCGLKRYRGMLLGMLVLGMYGVYSLVGFQQVLCTPLLFVVLGICERRYRRAESAKHLTDSA